MVFTWPCHLPFLDSGDHNSLLPNFLVCSVTTREYLSLSLAHLPQNWIGQLARVQIFPEILYYVLYRMLEWKSFSFQKGERERERGRKGERESVLAAFSRRGRSWAALCSAIWVFGYAPLAASHCAERRCDQRPFPGKRASLEPSPGNLSGISSPGLVPDVVCLTL